MSKTVATEVFPFLQGYGEQVGSDDSTLGPRRSHDTKPATMSFNTS
jgi:hypothetical protein